MQVLCEFTSLRKSLYWSSTPDQLDYKSFRMSHILQSPGIHANCLSSAVPRKVTTNAPSSVASVSSIHIASSPDSSRLALVMQLIAWSWLKSQRQSPLCDAAWPWLCTLGSLSVRPLATHLRRIVVQVIKPAAVTQAAVTHLMLQASARLMA